MYTTITRLYVVVITLLCWVNQSYSYVLTGIGNFAFGTIASPFPTLVLPNPSALNVCLSAGLLDSTNYRVTMSSSNGGTTAFRMASGTNTLAYRVYWASPSVLTEITPGVSTAFANAYPFLNLCPLSAPNIQLQIRLLSSDQMLARQGSYTDTLTILVTA